MISRQWRRGVYISRFAPVSLRFFLYADDNIAEHVSIPEDQIDMRRMNEAQIRMLKTVCREGSVIYSGRIGGRTARILEDMGFVTAEFNIVWVRQERRYSVVTVPRCRWTVRPTQLGFEVLFANSCSFSLRSDFGAVCSRNAIHGRASSKGPSPESGRWKRASSQASRSA